MPGNDDPTIAADGLAMASTILFLDQAMESDGPRTGQRGSEQHASRVIVRSGLNGHGADPRPSDRMDARQRSTFVTDLCQVSNKLVPIAAEPRFRPVPASTL